MLLMRGRDNPKEIRSFIYSSCFLMKLALRCQRILILSLLSVSMLVPIFIVSKRLKTITSSSAAQKEFIEDLSGIRYKADSLKLNVIRQETEEDLKEPALLVYRDGDLNSVDRENSSDDNLNYKETRSTGGSASSLTRNGNDRGGRIENQKTQPKNVSYSFEGKGQSNRKVVRHESNLRSQSHSVTDEKIREMKDQVIRAKAYLNHAPPGSNSHLVKELRLRIKEVERALGEATRDLELPRSASQRMRSMEASLSKAGRIYTDCSATATKLRAMTYNAEEQVQTQKNQAAYLVQLAARTTPKGLHCLSMQLTSDYFALQPEERLFPNQHKLQDPNLHHYAIFSDNVLACAVVVKSTISISMEPEKIVFHVVTDDLNLPAFTMWFLLNPGQATVHVQSIDGFEWLSSKYGSTLKSFNARDPRFASSLNHLRFYLPDVFPSLEKIVLLDHDVVVQRDLRGLWKVDMNGKVNGAVETCRESEPSFRRMDALINFSDPIVSKRFNVKACTWAFGMNLFDLKEWRRLNLTAVYHRYLQLGNRRQLWKAGTLPLGLVTFYNHTFALERRWHVLGLGYNSGVRRGDIERAAVIHYDGSMKPWLEIGINKYKGYWSKHVNYDHPYLQQCNIHD